MSLTPPPPPPPPPHRRPNLGPSGCQTPKFAVITTLNTQQSSQAKRGPDSAPTPSPSQLRQILADITKRVNNTPPLSSSSSTPGRHGGYQQPPVRRHLTTGSLFSSTGPTYNNRDLRSGPMTRSRSVHLSLTSSHSLSSSPRASRSHTPMTDENDFNGLLNTPTPNRVMLPSSIIQTASAPLAAGSHYGRASRTSTGGQLPNTPSLRTQPLPLRFESHPRSSGSRSTLPALGTASESQSPSLSSSASSAASQADSPPTPPVGLEPRTSIDLALGGRRLIDDLECSKEEDREDQARGSKRRRRNATGLGRL